MAGREVLAVNAKKGTPLHTAVMKGKVKQIRSLLARGADVNARNKKGETVLFCAVKKNSDLRLIKELLLAGGDVQCRDRNLNTLLHVAGNAEIVTELLSRGVSVNETNKDGETALHTAVGEDTGIEITEHLLAAGADVNAKNAKLATPLFYAVQYRSDLCVVEALLKAGGNVDCRDVNGDSLLHVVHTAKVAKILLSRGLNIHEANLFLFPPFYCVADNLFYSAFPVPEICYCLKKYREKLWQIETKPPCCHCREKDLVLTLILHGAVVRCDINSPLTIAIERENIPWAKFFIKADLLKIYLDGMEGTTDLTSYKSYLKSLRTSVYMMNESDYIELCMFLDNAVAEIVNMKYYMISDNLSLFNFFFKLVKSEKIFPLYPKSDNIDEEIWTKFPIYRDPVLFKIKASVKRASLLDKLKGLTIYAKKSGIKEISLKYYIIREIAEYLSDDDIANLINE